MSRLPADVLADLAFWGRTMQRAAERGDTLDAASLAEVAAVIHRTVAAAQAPSRAPENPEKRRARLRRYRERHGPRASIPASVRAAVLARDGDCCRQCGAEHDLHLDHVIPWVRGGSDDPENLQVLCGRCNRQKGARHG